MGAVRMREFCASSARRPEWIAAVCLAAPTPMLAPPNSAEKVWNFALLVWLSEADRMEEAAGLLMARSGWPVATRSPSFTKTAVTRPMMAAWSVAECEGSTKNTASSRSRQSGRKKRARIAAAAAIFTGRQMRPATSLFQVRTVTSRRARRRERNRTKASSACGDESELGEPMRRDVV